MTQDREKAVRARITGKVQGVFFRAWTRERAQKKSVRGWVKNCADGSVEAVFVGSARAVDDMIAACRTGPQKARVETMDTEPADAAAAPTQFEIRHR